MSARTRIAGLLLLLLATAVTTPVLARQFRSPTPHADAQGSALGERSPITLRVSDGGACPADYLSMDFARLLPDATLVERFRAPRGQVMVITDVQWTYNTREPTERDPQVLFLYLVNQATPSRAEIVFTGALLHSGDGQWFKVGEAHLTSGIAVSSQALLCVQVFPPKGQPLTGLTLQGYLAPDR
jgi:hypothetical protein